MRNKVSRLSYNQLILLEYFLENSQKPLSVGEISKRTNLSGKSLGGVLSSLSRTRYRGLSLIVPFGRPINGSGLRWVLNKRAVDARGIKKSVNLLLSSYI